MGESYYRMVLRQRSFDFRWRPSTTSRSRASEERAHEEHPPRCKYLWTDSSRGPTERALFRDVKKRYALRLLETKPLGAGMVRLRYRTQP